MSAAIPSLGAYVLRVARLLISPPAPALPCAFDPLVSARSTEALFGFYFGRNNTNRLQGGNCAVLIPEGMVPAEQGIELYAGSEAEGRAVVTVLRQIFRCHAWGRPAPAGSPYPDIYRFEETMGIVQNVLRVMLASSAFARVEDVPGPDNETEILSYGEVVSFAVSVPFAVYDYAEPGLGPQTVKAV